MIRYSQCPACGAKVQFRAGSSLLVICEYCRSNLLRQDQDVENLGKMAELLPDNTLLQIGSSGYHLQAHFSVIGRVQFQHACGVWNEWHVLFDSGKTGWLSESSGAYVMSAEADKSAVPDLPLSRYQPELSVPIQGKRLTVTRIEQADCIAGQGELPKALITGKTSHFVELSDAQTYATLEFSGEQAPTLFIGMPVALEHLHLAHLRDMEMAGIKTPTRQLQCPQCGGSLSIRLQNIQTVTCPHCTAVLDASHSQVATLLKYQKKLKLLGSPTLPLGSVGHFEQAAFTVTGYLQRSTRAYGTLFSWEEYLLHHPGYGFRWLVCSQGHWNILKPLLNAPKLNARYSRGPEALHAGNTYQHFAKYKSKVEIVAGEFYWQVQLGDTATIEDFIAPPYLLSKELQCKEINWSQGEYLTPEQVASAFKTPFNLPKTQGVFANQPNPYGQSVSAWRNATLLFMVAAIFIQLEFVMHARQQVVFSTSMQIANNPSDVWSGSYGRYNTVTSEVESDPFYIFPTKQNVIIELDGGLSNSWLYSTVRLIGLESGLTYSANREISDYSGYDGGEYWRENDSHAEIIFSAVPKGKYQLQIEAESDGSGDIQTRGKFQSVRVTSDVPLWGNFWTLVTFLLIGPALFYHYRTQFEHRRWADSDHPLNE